MAHTPEVDRASRRETVDPHAVKLSWAGLPDVGSPEFRAEARRQSRLIAASSQEADDLAFVSSLCCTADHDTED
ncbi:hypothetical protein STAQ_06550 [Allostella sp. ATCC 35155]|nr:hypothetical protein STAQ_06550 [Stella sp. ATCC 35155]